jgi:hypothetical protein
MLEKGTLPTPMLLIHATMEEALSLAKKLLPENQRSKVDSGNHPDLHIYLPEEKSDLHLMGTMQQMLSEMALPPFEAPVKIFIIDGAEKMLPASSNALLKTLEEPPEDTYFFLLSHHPDKLLPTILSRLHPMSFAPQEVVPYELESCFASAQSGEWDLVLEQLTALEKEESESLFLGCLEWAKRQKDPRLMQAAVEAVAKGQNALEYNIKLRSIIFNIIDELVSFC